MVAQGQVGHCQGSGVSSKPYSPFAGPRTEGRSGWNTLVLKPCSASQGLSPNGGISPAPEPGGSSGGTAVPMGRDRSQDSSSLSPRPQVPGSSCVSSLAPPPTGRPPHCSPGPRPASPCTLQPRVGQLVVLTSAPSLSPAWLRVLHHGCGQLLALKAFGCKHIHDPRVPG